MDHGEAEGREEIEELAELADVGEGPCAPGPHQALSALRLDKVDLLWVDGIPPPVGEVEQDAIVEDRHESSVRPPVASAVRRGLGRLNGCCSG